MHTQNAHIRNVLLQFHVSHPKATELGPIIEKSLRNLEKNKYQSMSEFLLHMFLDINSELSIVQKDLQYLDIQLGKYRNEKGEKCKN